MATTQDDRRFSITAPGGSKTLLLFREMTVQESVSGLFRIELSCLSESADIKFADMIGGPIAIRMSLPPGGGASERVFHGVIARFSQGRPVDRFVSYHAEVVPWLWFLTRGSDCRIFQNLKVPEIVTRVFEELGFADFEFSLRGKHEPREFAVQYRETHFNFVSRLLEEEGIGYFFEHGEKAHKLVLFDDPSAHPATAFAKDATAAALEQGDRAAGEVLDWVVEQELPSGRYAIKDFKMEDPGMDLLADTKSAIKLGGNERFEIYDYPGDYASLAGGQTRVKLRMQAQEAASHANRGRSARGDFSAGAKFELKGHFRKDFDGPYLITSVVHHASQSLGREKGGTSYENSFTCIPFAVPYRPLQRTPKPVISGAQTATVVGTKGEEIDVDEFGRVVVKFHWDRSEQRDEKSSCRVRVSQAWAGKGFGAVFHPRMGQEVIVEFLEGDPDRPIITGRVYNGEQKIPFDLPAQKTQSGIQSRSSKQGGSDNFNQIRLEDKKGAELIHVHAEKDYKHVVEADESDSVGHDRTRKVGNDETVEIVGNWKRTIGKDSNETVKGHQILTVEKSRGRHVQEDEAVVIDKDQSISVHGDHTLAVKGTDTHKVAKDWTLQVGGNANVAVTKEYALTAKKIFLQADDELSIKVGSAELVMKKNGDITLDGKKIQIKSSGDVVIKGSKVTTN